VLAVNVTVPCRGVVAVLTLSAALFASHAAVQANVRNYYNNYISNPNEIAATGPRVRLQVPAAFDGWPALAAAGDVCTLLLPCASQPMTGAAGNPGMGGPGMSMGPPPGGFGGPMGPGPGKVAIPCGCRASLQPDESWLRASL
jgi:hypothetical protein